MMSQKDGKAPGVIRSYRSLQVGILATALFTLFGEAWMADLSNPMWLGMLSFLNK